MGIRWNLLEKMKLILAAFGIFLCSTHVHADNPFLPVSDNSSAEVHSTPQPSPPPSPPSKSLPPTQNQSRLVIREKTLIERRPGVSPSERPPSFQSHQIIINQGTRTDGSQQSPIAVFVDEEREKERIALIPTPLLAQNNDDANDNDNDNGQFTQNIQTSFLENQQSQGQQVQSATSITTFTLGVNVLGETMLIANGPLPEDGVPVLVKTSNGFMGMILKPVDEIHFQSMNQQVQVQQEQPDQLDDQLQQDQQDQRSDQTRPDPLDDQSQKSQPMSPQSPLNQNVFAEFGDSFEREMRQRSQEMRQQMLTRGQRPTNFLKISGDGTYRKISGKTQEEQNAPKGNFDEMENSDEEDDDETRIWDPAAGIKAIKGKTFEEQQKINQAQREKLRVISGSQGKVPESSPQRVILVSSDPEPRLPKAILQSSDPHPNAPPPILVVSDPHKTLPQPILVERPGPVLPSGSRLTPQASLPERFVVAKDSSSPKNSRVGVKIAGVVENEKKNQKSIPASQPPVDSKVSKTKSVTHLNENVQSTETVAKKSGREMKVTLLESSEETD